MRRNRYLIDGGSNGCTICGEHIGNGFDHTECSKLKAEMHKGENETRGAKKKLTQKQCDGMCNNINSRIKMQEAEA